MALTLAACGHKVVANQGETTVAVYPDEETWQKLGQLKSQGGVVGMLGGLGQGLATKQVDNNTPIKIVSSDDNGSKVEVLDGANKGLAGFVPKSNVR
jgi:hypothetical protein